MMKYYNSEIRQLQEKFTRNYTFFAMLSTIK